MDTEIGSNSSIKRNNIRNGNSGLNDTQDNPPCWSPKLTRKEWTITEESSTIADGQEDITALQERKRNITPQTQRRNASPHLQRRYISPHLQTSSTPVQKRSMSPQSPKSITQYEQQLCTDINYQRLKRIVPIKVSQFSFPNEAESLTPVSPNRFQHRKNRRPSLTKDATIQDIQTEDEQHHILTTTSVRRKSINETILASDHSEDQTNENEMMYKRERRTSLTTKEIRETLKKTNRRSSVPNLGLQIEKDLPVIVGKDVLSLPQNDIDYDVQETSTTFPRRCSLSAIESQTASLNIKDKIGLTKKRKTISRPVNESEQPAYFKGKRNSMPVLAIESFSKSNASENIDQEEDIPYFRGRCESLPPITTDLTGEHGQFIAKLQHRRESLSENDIAILIKKNIPHPPLSSRRSHSIDLTNISPSIAIKSMEHSRLYHDSDKVNPKGRRLSLPHNMMVNPHSLDHKKSSKQTKKKESTFYNASINEVRQKIIEKFECNTEKDNASNTTETDAQSNESFDSDSSMTVMQENIEDMLSISDETLLPPRTPEPEIFTDFKMFGENTADGSNEENMKSYNPRYCWCTRCQLMYRMFKDNDDGLNNWGNYPCYHF